MVLLVSELAQDGSTSLERARATHSPCAEVIVKVLPGRF
jgi:hypothetical protein